MMVTLFLFLSSIMQDHHFNLWFAIVGLLFISMALAGSLLKRLPLSSSLLYLLAGVALGPLGWKLMNINPVEQAKVLERVTEVAVIISLFTSGLKLRVSLKDHLWRLPLRLAFGSMIITVALITVIGVFLLRLPLGAAILLGAVLAPTDPVLASDVQVENASDSDRLRFSLTGEAGLNDGSAFPFVMLGLGLLGLHELGDFGWRWFAVDVLWAVLAGLGIGALFGNLVAHIVLYLRRQHKEAVGLDDFLVLGLIAMSYGVALLCHAYGFLAVFAAGLALRATERKHSGEKPPEEAIQAAETGQKEEIATHPELAPAYMAQAVLDFNEQLERIGEVAVVLLVGGMLSLRLITLEMAGFVALMLFVVRPIATHVGLLGARASRVQRGLIGWFGIRGIGSIYYLMYAIAHDLPTDISQRLVDLTFAVVASSIILHGISVTPLMNVYSKRMEARTKRKTAESSA
jgi:NhaP-type Na+/H+ or K+/H+ antiporter